MNKNLTNSKKTCEALFSERLYQEMMWNKDTTESGGNHSDIEFFVFIDDYLREAINIVSRNPEPMASVTASENIRKIAAMVIAAAEKNNWDEDLENWITLKNTNEIQLNYSVVESLGLIKSFLNKGYGDMIDTKNITPEQKNIAIRKVLNEILFISLCCMNSNYSIVRTLPNTQDSNSKKEAFEETVDLFVTGKKNEKNKLIESMDDAINYIKEKTKFI